MSFRRAAAFAVTILLAGIVSSSGQNAALARDASGQASEIRKAEAIADPAARLRELLRIRSGLAEGDPGSARLESDIVEARIDLATTVQAVLALQKAAAGQGRGAARMTSFVQAAARIVDHPRFTGFEPDRVLAAVLGYREQMERAATEPETLAAMPDPEDRKTLAARLLGDFQILLARAWANAGDGANAAAALEEYRAAGGEAGPDYLYARGDACAVLGRFKEAYGFYLGAAIERRPGAEEKAKAAYEVIHGGAEGFEARLDELRSALPFRPAPFSPPKRWRGKTVLAELFTNSENALCLASDLAVGGLARTYPERYLAILEYHVSVPRPDPLTNPAAEARRGGYRITSTPTVVIDGGRRLQGGGTRAAAESVYNQYKAYIDGQLVEEPDLKLKAKAGRTGDLVQAAISANRARPGSEHYVALVQARERMKGASGTIVHRLIVRDLVAVDPVRDKTVVFDLSAVERASEALPAAPGENRTRIDRERLRIVYFVQDTGSRRILNAVVSEIESR